MTLSMNAQQYKLPFSEIDHYPETYTEANIMLRMIQGLGYRYYWATESLNETDLAYRPSADGRSTFETLEHIYGLSLVMAATFEGWEYDYTKETYPFAELREQTLNNFEIATKVLQQTDSVAQFDINVVRAGNKMSFPFWNMINGPIADAIWHSGQIVLNRRASGNPINAKVNVFMGKNSH
jgi:hypothetical protein